MLLLYVDGVFLLDLEEAGRVRVRRCTRVRRRDVTLHMKRSIIVIHIYRICTYMLNTYIYTYIR